jgi:hypothetical protein
MALSGVKLDDHGWGAWESAINCFGDKNRSLQVFLMSGSDPNYFEGKPLIHAVESGKTSAAQFLLLHGADPRLSDGAAIAIAKRKGHNNILQMLEVQALELDGAQRRSRGQRAQAARNLRGALRGLEQDPLAPPPPTP